MKKDTLAKASREEREQELEYTALDTLAQPAKAEPKPKRFHTSVYLDKEFYTEIKIALLREGEDRDFNRLVNDLLREWYEEHSE